MAFSQETSGAKQIFLIIFFLSQLCVTEQSLPSGAQGDALTRVLFQRRLTSLV